VGERSPASNDDCVTDLRRFDIMLKKTLAAAAFAAVLVLGGASAASADYTPDPPTVVVSDTTPAVGQTITITFNNLNVPFVRITVNPGQGVTLASVVRTAASGGVEKQVVNGSASAQFTASTAGTYTVSAADASGNVVGSQTLSVGTSSSGGSSLPATGGGDVPAAVIWLGVGAVGIGGIAVAAAVARRRAAVNR
jgi:hypothetical protein